MAEVERKLSKKLSRLKVLPMLPRRKYFLEKLSFMYKTRNLSWGYDLWFRTADVTDPWVYLKIFMWRVQAKIWGMTSLQQYLEVCVRVKEISI